MSGIKCMHRLRSGAFCQRYASHGSKFCAHHEGSLAHFSHHDGADLHPLARLTTPEDVFDVLREALNATRLGRMSAAQAHALGHLAAEWRKTYELLCMRQRESGLHRQILGGLVEDDMRMEAEQSEAPHPLPVQVDNVAVVAQPDPKSPPFAPIDTYPGWKEKHGRRRSDRTGDAPEIAPEPPIPAAAAAPACTSRPDASEPRERASDVVPFPASTPLASSQAAAPGAAASKPNGRPSPGKPG